MNHPHIIRLIILSLALIQTLPIFAQDHPGRDENPTRENRAERPRNPDVVGRWMMMLRQENPEEFNRLKELKENDPAAFKTAMKERLRARREQSGPRRHNMGRPQKPLIDPEVQQQTQTLETELRQIAKTIREQDKGTPVPEDITSRARKIAGELFDIRQTAHQKAFKALEENLQHMKKAAEIRQQNRDEIIERHLSKILNPNPHSDKPTDRTPPDQNPVPRPGTGPQKHVQGLE